MPEQVGLENTVKLDEEEQDVVLTGENEEEESSVAKVDDSAADGDDDDEDDMVDPMDTLRESCKEQRNCHALVTKMEACTQRVEARSKNTEECTEELLDLVHCVDACVSKHIHSTWK